MEMVRVRENQKPLHEVYGEPDVEELRRDFLFDSCEVIDNFLASIPCLEKVDRLIFLFNVELDRVFDKAQLKDLACPRSLENHRQGIG